MKRVLLLAMCALMVTPIVAGAQNNYGWSLSESPSDPCVTTGTPTFAVKTIYLWHTYATNQQMSAADISAAGSIAPLAFNASNGYLNAGDAVNLLLAVGGCPMPPINAGNFLIVDTGGNMELAGARLTVDCVVNDPYLSGTTGWSSDGSTPVEYDVAGGTGCTTISVEGTSWGSVKNMYR